MFEGFRHESAHDTSIEPSRAKGNFLNQATLSSPDYVRFPGLAARRFAAIVRFPGFARG